MNPRRAAMRLLASACVVLVAWACGSPGMPPRTPFVAVWISSESLPPTRSDLTRLAAAGALELFVEAAELRLAGELPRLDALALRRIEREGPVTLVVRGTWSAPPAAPREVARSWRESLLSIEAEMREMGGLPVGVHYELSLAGGAEALAETLSRLRRELAGRLYLSVALPPAGRLEEETLARLASSVDFVVGEIYGQSPGEPDDPSRWDREESREALARLERLGVPYAASAWTLGRNELRPRRGASSDLGGGLPIGRLARSPQFSPRPGAVFSGVDRQVLEFEAREPASIGPWQVARGDVVRVARPTTHDLEALLATWQAASDAKRVGLILRRLPAPGDVVSLGVVSLAAALEPGEAAPRLTTELIPEGNSRGRFGFRVGLRNLGSEATDLAGGDWNYVQIELATGSIARVEPGDFVGWEQLYRGTERRTVRALREADTLRLYVPYLGADEALESGRIEVRGSAGARPEIRVSGRFLLPGGRELAIAPAPAQWVDRE